MSGIVSVDFKLSLMHHDVLFIVNFFQSIKFPPDSTSRGELIYI